MENGLSDDRRSESRLQAVKTARFFQCSASPERDEVRVRSRLKAGLRAQPPRRGIPHSAFCIAHSP